MGILNKDAYCITSLFDNRTLVCHDMQGGYIGDHWEDGCQVMTEYEILREKIQPTNNLLICPILLRSGSSNKDLISEVAAFLCRQIAIMEITMI